jgi:integrase
MSVFKKQGVYWIDYYVSGHRKRERIGPDKRLAETVLSKRKVEIAEGKFLERQRPVTTTFDELADAYLKWISPDEQAGIPARKRSWRSHDLYAIGQLRAYFGDKRLMAITPALVGQYRDWRRFTISRRHRPVSTATVNRELACLKRMFNVACKGLIMLKGGVPALSPIANVSLEREHNERDRVLGSEEFDRLYAAAEDWLKPILLIGYHTGMRKGEIRSLRWDQVDVKRQVIRLKSGDTKTGEGRVIPLNQGLTAALKSATRYLGCPWVFVNPAMLGASPASSETVDARYHATSITHAFMRACEKAAVKNATFHDLRHTFVTNARRAGIDYFRIMAITGHRTMSVFKRYNTVDEVDLRQAMSQMDTYMDTSPEMDTPSSHVSPGFTSRSRRSSAGRATDS